MTHRAILGGSFDPPHVGHLHLAHAARKLLGVEEIRLIPAGRPPHKQGRTHSSSEQRWAMCQELVRGAAGNPAELPWLIADDRELRREGMSYSIDTVQELLAEFPDTTQLDFLIGSDLLPGLPTWSRAPELAQRVRFVVVPRPSSSRLPTAVSSKDPMDPPAAADSSGSRDSSNSPDSLSPAGFRVQWLDTPPVPAASREIRRRIAEGLPTGHWIPAAIQKQIRDFSLYGSQSHRLRPAQWSALFPNFVEIETADARDSRARFDQEAALMENVGPPRRAEFLSTRDAARRALARLGLEEQALLSGDDGAPLWPLGSTGSLSHKAQYCVAAVAPTKRARALGIDLERLRPLPPRLLQRLFTEEERAAFSKSTDLEPGYAALIAFSAKECFYKAQWMLSGQFLGFQDAQIVVCPQGDFEVRLRAAVPELPPELPRGRWVGEGDWIATGLCFPRRMSQPPRDES